MGKFVTPAERGGKFAVVDGSGMETATPFPRIRSLRREIERERSKDSPSESDPNVTGQDVPPSDSIMPSSSDEVAPRTHSESSPDTFDLDDVLEPSFLDLEPVTPERNTTMSAPATISLWNASSSSSVLPLPQNDLSRWDRIPVATFRRTRESAFTEYPGSDTSVGGMGTPMSHSLLKGRDKAPSKSSEKRSKGKRAQKLVISPVLLPLRDGDGLLTDAHFAPTNEPPPNQNHQNKSRKERKENNAKRKAMGKYTSRRSQQQQQGHQHHHHHGHFPNMKSRGSGSMQRTNFFAGSSSSVPHLSL
ncbi:hypothetical protein QCA50_009186 [Cerrena zonata]|uniref:Uncharacterized protein n=1 Tax=Cerrena zonata TaxID=2478898 RepID=A0AAW0G6D4_9APHY